MTNYDATTEKRIANEHIRAPCYLGLDGGGAVHFYSLSSSKLCIVDGQDYVTVDYVNVADGSLHEWARMTQTKRGAWQDGPKLASSDDLLEAMA